MFRAQQSNLHQAKYECQTYHRLVVPAVQLSATIFLPPSLHCVPGLIQKQFCRFLGQFCHRRIIERKAACKQGNQDQALNRQVWNSRKFRRVRCRPRQVLCPSFTVGNNDLFSAGLALFVFGASPFTGFAACRNHHPNDRPKRQAVVAVYCFRLDSGANRGHREVEDIASPYSPPLHCCAQADAPNSAHGSPMHTHSNLRRRCFNMISFSHSPAGSVELSDLL